MWISSPQIPSFLSYLAELVVFSLEPSLPPWRDGEGRLRQKQGTEKKMGNFCNIFVIFFHAK
jgi:hypothetical protein